MSEKLDLLRHFPYPQAREIQAQALRTLAEHWDQYDVFVVSAPTAFGKTAVARTLMNALRSVSVITPTNLLVEQFTEEFPDTGTLHRMDKYWCEEWQRPCMSTRNKLMKFCKGCQCGKDMAQALYTKGPGVYNYHIYMAHQLYRDVLVVDEAHNLIPVIRDRMGMQVWQHNAKYPDNMYTTEQMLQWYKSLPDKRKRTKYMEAFGEAVLSPNPRYVVQRTKDWFNGKGTKRGEPEERDCIKLLPVDISDAPPMFWPGLGSSVGKAPKAGQVGKIVLLSATIGPKDIDALGLGGRGKKVLYVDCKSPIPPRSRPIVALDIASVNRHNVKQVIPLLADTIKQLASKHEGEKGVIHATYQVAHDLRQHLSGSRYIFHTRDDKTDRYREFRETDPGRGSILVASGMYEGIDLPQDLGRWQVIAKVPWQSLGSPAIKHLADRDPEWFMWETVKTLIQACGRICRTPEDFGVTYILDSTVQKILQDSNYMLPDWFADALVSDIREMDSLSTYKYSKK